MTVVHYIGSSDVRVVTTANFQAAGVNDQTTATFNRSTNWQQNVSTAAATFLLAQTDFGNSPIVRGPVPATDTDLIGHIHDTHRAHLASGVELQSVDGLDARDVQSAFTEITEDMGSLLLDVGYDIIVVAGQSNASGRGTPVNTARLDPVDPRIWQYSSNGTYANTINLAVDPLDQIDVATGIGPATPFARWYVDTVPGRRVLIVPCAKGSTGFAVSSDVGTWAVDGTGLNLYDLMVERVTATLSAAGAGSRIVAFLWHQGEANSNGTQEAYEEYFDEMLAAARADIPGFADVPVIVGGMVPEWVDLDSVREGVHTAHVETGYRNLLAAFAYGPLGNSPTDLIHYDAASQRLLGKAMFDALALARANVLGVSPLPPTNVVLTQSNTTVDITWDRPVCRVTNYLIERRINGGSWATVPHDRSIDINYWLAAEIGDVVDVRVSSINEEGTSEPSTVVSITLVPLPVQPTGLAATPSSYSAALNWSDVADATSYTVEYKRSDDADWIVHATGVTASERVVTGLSSATEYDFRVSAVNVAGTGPVSAVVTSITGAALILDDAVSASAYAAYGLRKLTSTATNAIKVRRSTDNTEQDIGFTASGELDEAALLAFCGAGSGFVTTWYDQSGSGRNATQTTTAAQPRIVNAGVLNQVNARPALFFDGTDDWLNYPPGLWAAGAASILATVKGPAGANRAVVGEGRAASTASRYMPMYATGAFGSLATQVRSDANVTVISSTLSSSYGVLGADVLVCAAVVDTGTQLRQEINGVGNLSATYSRTGHTITIDSGRIGHQLGSGTPGFAWTSDISEVVLFTTALSDVDRGAGVSNQSEYFAV